MQTLASLVAVTLAVAVLPAVGHARQISIEMSGVVGDINGDAPHGIAEGASFSAVFSYGRYESLEFLQFVLTQPQAVIAIEIDGRMFVSEREFGPVSTWYQIFYVDPREPEVPTEPDEYPHALLRHIWLGFSRVRDLATNELLWLGFGFSKLYDGGLPQYLTDFDLPRTPADAAELIGRTSDFNLDHITIGNRVSSPIPVVGGSVCDNEPGAFCIRADVEIANPRHGSRRP